MALRHADVRVSPAETLDALAIAERIGWHDRGLLKDALALTLAKSIDEKARFDETFERFFNLAFREPVKASFVRPVDTTELLGALAGQLSIPLHEHLETALAEDHSKLSLAVARAAEQAGVHRMASLREKPLVVGEIERALKVDELDQFLKDGAGAEIEGQGGALLRYLRKYFRDQVRAYVDEQYRLNVDATGKKSLLEAALRSNLDQLPKAYHDDVRAVVLKLADKLAREHRRRRKRAHRGQLDIRKTIRKNVAYDGALFDLHWRMQKRERSTVYVLCDVSSSVARIARFLLLFLYELRDVLPNVRAFAFSSRLGEVSETFAKRPSEEAIEEALFVYGNGATDYSRSLADFRDLCGRDLDHRSTLIILGDGRNNFYDPRATLFKDLANRCKQVFWLNPETRDQWHEGDSEMRRYAPYCTRVALCTKLRDIERFADDLLKATL